MSTGAPEHARERGARGARADVRQLAQGVELEVGVLSAHAGSFRSGGDGRGRGSAPVERRRRSRRSGRSAPSDSTAAPERAEPSATSGGSGRVTSSRWPTSRGDREREPARRRRARSTAWSPPPDRGRRPRPKRSAASTIGSTPSRMTSIRRAGDRADRVVGEARPCARCGRAGSRTARPSASTSSAAMIASVSGRRICAVVPRPCSEVMHAPRRPARGSWCAPRPCRRRGRRCRS